MSLISTQKWIHVSSWVVEKRGFIRRDEREDERGQVGHVSFYAISVQQVPVEASKVWRHPLVPPWNSGNVRASLN
jgi:hypothetical protein